jgi:anti-anti-sigma regulatory factor
MEVKIDTKEKFTVVMPQVPHIYDNMAADLAAACTVNTENKSTNIILNLQAVTAIDDDAALSIAKLQHSFYERNTSFVICEMKRSVEAIFEKLELMDVINSTPTESEAWDILQMEEIERELLDSDEIEFDVEE